MPVVPGAVTSGLGDSVGCQSSPRIARPTSRGTITDCQSPMTSPLTEQVRDRRIGSARVRVGRLVLQHRMRPGRHGQQFALLVRGRVPQLAHRLAVGVEGARARRGCRPCATAPAGPVRRLGRAGRRRCGDSSNSATGGPSRSGDGISERSEPGTCSRPPISHTIAHSVHTCSAASRCTSSAGRCSTAARSARVMPSIRRRAGSTAPRRTVAAGRRARCAGCCG